MSLYVDRLQNNNNDIKHSKVIKVFISLPCKPFIPYEVVKYLCKQNLKGIITTAMKVLNINSYDDADENIMVTSCVNNSRLLSVIFLGVEKAKRLHKIDTTSYTCEASFTTAKGIEFSYKIYDLFKGVLSSQIEDCEAFHSLKTQQQLKFLYHIRGGTRDFFKYTSPFVDDVSYYHDKECVEKVANSYFNDLGYSFNDTIIENLRTEICRNSLRLSEDKSYIYYISIKNAYAKEKSSYEHAFMLEQFSYEGFTYFRLYQTWVKQATLQDTNSVMWDQDQLNSFLDKLSRVYCKKHTNETVHDCFGFNHKFESPPPLLEFVDNKLFGISMSYFSAEFNPEDCLANLEMLMNSD